MSKGQSPQLQIEYCSPHELRPCPYNATFHSKQQIQKIVKSLRRFGCVNPVLVSDTKEIIAGHARVKAATYLDLKLIPIIRLSNLTPAERLAYNLADNRLARFARYDRDLLSIQLEELTNLKFDEVEITGFSLIDADIRLEDTAKKTRATVASDDVLPAREKIAVSRKRDLWTVGDNRLFCGDSISATAWFLTGSMLAAVAAICGNIALIVQAALTKLRSIVGGNGRSFKEIQQSRRQHRGQGQAT